MDYGTRRGDGGTYLIIADDTEEFQIALDYACNLAQTRRGNVAVAHITEAADFVHWGKVEEMIRSDMRQNAEDKIRTIASKIYDEYGLQASLYICEGSHLENIVSIINDERRIRSLVLAGANSGSGPGPLISHFSGKGMADLRVPVVIVPGHFDKENIEAVINPLHLGRD